MKKFFYPIILAGILSSLVFADDMPVGEPTYQEIPYYLNKLRSATLEDERVKYNKIIHDAVVNSDLSNKKVVKQMTPLMERLRQAIDENLDRTNLSGQAGWLASAIEYFNREKLIPNIPVAPEEMLPPQQEAGGIKISSFPDKIIVSQNEKNDVLLESSNIHEAVISPDGKKVAFFRNSSAESPQAEVWVYKLKNKKGKKIAVVPSAYTLLFSLVGDKIFIQLDKEMGESESDIYSISAGGGSLKKMTRGSLLETLIGTGKYQGCLIIYKTTISHLGGKSGQSCGYIFKSNGKMVGRIKGPVCK